MRKIHSIKESQDPRDRTYILKASGLEANLIITKGLELGIRLFNKLTQEGGRQGAMLSQF